MFMHWLMTHDWTQFALASSVMTLGLVVALEVRAFTRLRHEVTRDLARIFEQLDLVRFETQQLRELPVRPASASVAALRPVERSTPRAPLERAAQRAPGERGILSPAPELAPQARDSYSDAARMAADGAQAHEIAMKCGLATGEARILVGLQAARSRRINS
jgi:Protein of unknown function (DUF2802)